MPQPYFDGLDDWTRENLLNLFEQVHVALSESGDPKGLSDALSEFAAMEKGERDRAYRQLRDPAQSALDSVLSILTDEQAETVPGAFPEWAAGIAYAAGTRVRHSDALWRCIQAHTSQERWEPGAAPSLWSRIGEPGDEWPEWVQPTGAHDAYAAGDKVSHAGKRWTSDIDANAYEPGVYGWTQAD